MAGVSTGGDAKGKRNVDQEVNMVPFIDLLLVTISFLLVTAVWTSLARVPASTAMPGHKTEEKTVEPRALHVRIEGKTAALSWQKGQKVDDLAKVPLAELEREIKKAAVGSEPGTAAVVHVPNAMPMGELTDVLDAVHGGKVFAVALGS